METPAFTTTQTPTHVHVAIDLPQTCPGSCIQRAVVDGGSVFGVACPHFHLPLVFPGDAPLIDGMTASSEAGDCGAIGMRRSDATRTLLVDLTKRAVGIDVPGLDALRPSIFAPAHSGDAEADEEERVLGLEILQRGIDAAKTKENGSEAAATESVDETQQRSHVNSVRAGRQLLPRSPRLGTQAKSRIHEASNGQEPHRQAGNSSLTIRKTHQQRLQAAWDAEDAKWDEGMYLDSFVDEEGEVRHLVEAPLPLQDASAEHERPHDSDVQGQSFQAEQRRDLHLLLMELLLAQAYDGRTTMNDPTVESPWTISVLCRSLVAASLPHSAAGSSVNSVLIGSFRRQLSYMLYRNWVLSVQVTRDVVTKLLGKQGPSDEPTRSVFAQMQSLAALLEQGRNDDAAIEAYLDDVLLPLISCFPICFRCVLRLGWDQQFRLGRKTF